MRYLAMRMAMLAGVATAVAAALVLFAIPPALSAATPVRVMPLGDSITGSPGCWRALLWSRLQANGFTDVDFVGTQAPQGCSIPYDGDHEGHGGALATAVADQNQLPAWLAAARPHIVVMHFGTNDVWSNRSVPVILAAFDKLVDQMRASDPTMRILVAQIIPMAASACAECPSRVVAFNAALPGWAAGRTTAMSPIVVVDQWTGFNTTTDTFDGVHPNDAGNAKIADRWYPAVATALTGSTQTPTVLPSTTTTTRPPTTPPTRTTTTTTAPPTTPSTGGLTCAATFRVAGQWNTGFQGEVTVANNGARPTTRWTVRLRFANGQTITQSWGASVVQSGADVTATNTTWNGALNPSAATTFGFLANWSGTNAAPTLTCTAG